MVHRHRRIPTLVLATTVVACLLAVWSCGGGVDECAQADCVTNPCPEGEHREQGECVPDEENGGTERPDIDGTYTCTFTAVDDDVLCGGPVLGTDLRGSGQTMNVTESESRVEIGIWGVVLEGGLRDGGYLEASYEDTECSSCSVEDPYQIELTGQADGDGIQDIEVRAWQTGTGYGLEDCEKTYEGSCAVQ